MVFWWVGGGGTPPFVAVSIFSLLESERTCPDDLPTSFRSHFVKPSKAFWESAARSEPNVQQLCDSDGTAFGDIFPSYRRDQCDQHDRHDRRDWISGECKGCKADSMDGQQHQRAEKVRVHGPQFHGPHVPAVTTGWRKAVLDEEQRVMQMVL